MSKIQPTSMHCPKVRPANTQWNIVNIIARYQFKELQQKIPDSSKQAYLICFGADDSDKQ